jgi:hypothetical protein
VEARYGKEIKEVIDSGQRIDVPARSKIEDDGTPVIRIHPESGKNETVITHELMHLFGWAEGVPWVGFRGDRYVDPLVIAFVRDDLYDQVFHSYFYPKMRQMGIAPAAQEREWLHEAIRQRRPLPIASRPLAHASLALYYFRSSFILEDEALATQFAAIFEAESQSRALVEGKRLVEIVSKYSFTEPDEVLDAFVEAANSIFAGALRFSVQEVKNWPRGKLEVRLATIFVEPTP